MVTSREYYEKNKDRIKQQTKEYYLKNKESRLEYQREYRKKNRDFLSTRDRNKRKDRLLWAINFLGGKCLDCGGIFDPCVYDFHHNMPAEKDFTIGENMLVSEDRFKQEIKKCSLLCANCHRLRHKRKKMQSNRFKNSFSENIFKAKYSQGINDTWDALADRLVEDVCGTRWGKDRPLMSQEDRDQLAQYIKEMKFVPGGRYLWYAGRQNSYFNNCFLLRAEEDTREEWAALTQRAVSCLMTGGGIGIDYSRLRPSGKPLSRTGGLSSGPIPLMQMINEVGRGVMQGGSRRSAIYASLNWLHEDIPHFLTAKNWTDQVKELKNNDFNFPAPLDMTNISVNYDDKWLYNADRANLHTFVENCRQAMKTGEPGFSFNFGDKQDETLRNACTEVTSADDSDVCNLGSINMSNIKSIDEFKHVVELGSKFLVCGTLRADLPYEKVYKVREKNRRLGLGLMGIHAWLLQRGYGYEVVPELHEWLKVWKDESERAANEHCDRLYITKPVAYRAIAPTGSIGILAGTTTGIEPLFAVAYKRRYLTDGTKWKYEYVVDSTADQLIKEYGLDPNKIETAYGLAHDYEKRIKFQADIQDYTDMSISSTINLPAWGSKGNTESDVLRFARVLSEYAPRLRGFTCYPDGSRGGQPLTECSYEEAIKHKGVVFDENVDRACSSGVCGI